MAIFHRSPEGNTKLDLDSKQSRVFDGEVAKICTKSKVVASWLAFECFRHAGGRPEHPFQEMGDVTLELIHALLSFGSYCEVGQVISITSGCQFSGHMMRLDTLCCETVLPW